MGTDFDLLHAVVCVCGLPVAPLEMQIDARVLCRIDLSIAGLWANESRITLDACKRNSESI